MKRALIWSLVAAVALAPLAKAQCPTGGLSSGELAAALIPPPGTPCDDDGTRQISLICRHDVAGLAPQATWIHGDGSPDFTFTFGPGVLFSHTHAYAPGSHTALLSIVGCEPEDTPVVSFVLSDCPDQFQRCPNVDFREFIGDCDESSGSQFRSIKVTLIGDAPFSAELVFEDQVRDSGTDSNGTLELTLDQLFPDGTHSVQVNVTSPAYCGSSSYTFSVDCSNGDACITCFCGGILCCILWLLFLVSLVAMIVALARSLCGVGSVFTLGIFLALAIAFAVFLIVQCDVGICELLLAMAGAGIAGHGVVCGTNVIPSTCESWLCAKTNIPGTGAQVANLLIVDVLFTLFALVICYATDL